MNEHTIKTYSYDELSREAKEKAIEDFRNDPYLVDPVFIEEHYQDRLSEYGMPTMDQHQRIQQLLREWIQNNPGADYNRIYQALKDNYDRNAKKSNGNTIVYQMVHTDPTLEIGYVIWKVGRAQYRHTQTDYDQVRLIKGSHNNVKRRYQGNTLILTK
jgi:hypothetical protein